MYRIGQLTKEQMTNYMDKLAYRQTLLDTEDTIIVFQNPCLNLSGTNVVSSLFSYYIKFKVKQSTAYTQDFVIKLKNSKYTQEIKTLNVKKGNDYTSFELIFTPNATYNQIIFELKRTNIDFGTTSRVMNVTISTLSKINNVIETYLSSKYSGLANLKKIGLQGKSNLLFTINGEEIRIGRSGIYELYHQDITITYLGFVIDENTKEDEYFILDFKY